MDGDELGEHFCVKLVSFLNASLWSNGHNLGVEGKECAIKGGEVLVNLVLFIVVLAKEVELLAQVALNGGGFGELEDSSVGCGLVYNRQDSERCLFLLSWPVLYHSMNNHCSSVVRRELNCIRILHIKSNMVKTYRCDILILGTGVVEDGAGEFTTTVETKVEDLEG